MDADDDELCKAYEPIAESTNYTPVMIDELVELVERLSFFERLQRRPLVLVVKFQSQHVRRSKTPQIQFHNG
jgi:hypothetical protein